MKISLPKVTLKINEVSDFKDSQFLEKKCKNSFANSELQTATELILESKGHACKGWANFQVGSLDISRGEGADTPLHSMVWTKLYKI